MSQFTTAQEQALAEPYLQFDLDPHKQVDFAVVIGGWPTIYTVCKGDYTIPSTGDLSTATGFTAIRKWANFPSGAAAKLKGRLESGQLTIGQMDVSIADVNEIGTRALSDLISRQAYLEGVSPGSSTTLTGAINASTQTVVLGSGSYNNGDLIYISRECIKLGGKQGDNVTFNSCTRGYLKTSPVPHATAVKVYGFKPDLYRTRAWIYKGYQGLPLDKWTPAFGGVVTGEEKRPGAVRLSIKSTTWETYADRTRKLGAIRSAGNSTALIWLENVDPALAGDYVMTIKHDIPIPSGLADGHHAIEVAGCWMGITGFYTGESTVGGRTVSTVIVVKGLSNTAVPEIGETNYDIKFAWTPIDLSTTPPVGLDPITLMLRLLMSTSGNGDNGTYDVYQTGVGLAIPQNEIDVSSFTAVQSAPEYDTNARVFPVFKEPVDAKKFIEEELCKPFGWFILTGSDGRIKLVWPKHPQKFHTSRANNIIRVKAPIGGSLYEPRISSGVRTGPEIASAIQTALNTTTGQNPGPGGFTVSFDTTARTFSLTRSTDSWELDHGISASTIWNTIGFTNDRNVAVNTPTISDVVGAFVATDFNTVTKNDLWDARPVDNRDDSIIEVYYHANWDWQNEQFRLIKRYVDAELTNLVGSLGSFEYHIESKGLLINNQGVGIGKTQMGSYSEPLPADPCKPIRNDVSTSYGLDASNSWASLVASMLFDRYRHPPVAFTCKLPWKFNTKEVGDVLRVTYDVDGVFADRERNTTTLTSRLFQVRSIKPAFDRGYLEVELVGFRYTNY